MDMNDTDLVKQRVWQRIDERAVDLTAFLAAYVQRRSVNPGRAPEDEPGETRTCQAWLAAELAAWEVFDRIDVWDGAPNQPNIAAIIGGRGGVGQDLLYNGHTDTVGVSAEQRASWRGGDPWSGEIADGNLYGRGATDMKGGNAAFLWAARMLRECGFTPAARCVATISIGEETSEAEIGPLSVLARGYRAPLAINGEPTRLQIAPAGMGWFFFQIDVTGKSLHPAARYSAVYPQASTAPLPGVDAIEKMRTIMDALSALDRDWSLHEKHPLMPPGGMNLSPVQIGGGALRAEMPPACSATYAVVVQPAADCAAVLAEIERAVAAVTATDRWLRDHPPRVTCPVIHRVLPPLDVPQDHPGVLALARASREALAREPVIGCFPGPCDANIMAAADQPTIIFGPGDLGYGAHGANEFVPVQQVIDACKVYAGLIVDWCGMGDEGERGTRGNGGMGGERDWRRAGR
ncbi:MAG: M20/M25/M40 family metallo-hydrolase [Thermomicrobiales bacterium]